MPLEAESLVPLATAIGASPLTAFSVALSLLLLTVGATWFAVHRYYIRRHNVPDTWVYVPCARR